MIDVSTYLLKLEKLRIYLAWRIDVCDKLAGVKVDSDRMAAYKWFLFASVKTMNFETFINQNK
jgi:hypothetical protein